MTDYLDTLARCPLFAGVSEADLRAMLGCLDGRVIRAERGAPILSEGSPAEEVGVLLSGSARVLRDDFYGNRDIQAVLEPGDLFGETFACAGAERIPVTVEAAEPSAVMLVRLRRITQTCSSACEFHNRVVLNLLRAIAEKNLRLNQKLDITGRRTTREKLMAYLLYQAKRVGMASFTIPLDRQGLADYLGVERSALSAEIGRLRREGVIESERSSFRLLKGAEDG